MVSEGVVWRGEGVVSEGVVWRGEGVVSEGVDGCGMSEIWWRDESLKPIITSVKT